MTDRDWGIWMETEQQGQFTEGWWKRVKLATWCRWFHNWKDYPYGSYGGAAEYRTTCSVCKEKFDCWEQDRP